MTTNTVLLSAETYPITGIPRGWPIGIDTGVTTDFSLITYGTCNFDVDWGDGNTETVDNVSPITTFTTTHNYSTPGTYTVEITINSGDFRPYYNNNAAGDEIVTLGDTPDGWSFGTTLQTAFTGSANLATIGDIDTSAVTSFLQAFNGCPSLTSFPLINTSNATQFQSAWRDDSGLLDFPAIDTGLGLDFSYAWYGCSSLIDFPALNMSSAIFLTQTWYNCFALESFSVTDFSSLTGTFSATWRNCTNLDNITALGDTYSFPTIICNNAVGFSSTWNSCAAMTSFPPIAPTSATTFTQSWFACSNLTTFPPNVFDVTGTLVSSAFNLAFRSCALTAQSIENILVSLDTNGATGVTLDISLGTNASKATWSAAANTAYDNLIGKGWTVNHNP